MEIKGKVIAILPIATGQGKNGEWKSQDFVIETSGTYPKKVCINLYGDKISLIPNIDEIVNVSVELESREYNGRWFTSVRAWKIDKEQLQPQAQQAPTPQGEGDSLPF